MSGPFIPVEVLLLDRDGELWKALGPTALLAYLALRAAQWQYTHAGGKRGREAREAKSRRVFFESEKRLAGRVGLSVSSIKRTIQVLRRVGLVEVAETGGKGRANRYRVHEVTPFVLAEAVQAARALHGTGHREPKYGSERTVHGVRVNGITGHSELRTRSEIEIRREEGKARALEATSTPERTSPNGNTLPKETEVLRYQAFLEVHRGGGGVEVFQGVRRALASRLGCAEEEAERLLRAESKEISEFAEVGAWVVPGDT